MFGRPDLPFVTYSARQPGKFPYLSVIHPLSTAKIEAKFLVCEFNGRRSLNCQIKWYKYLTMDWKHASIAAAVFLGIAALVVYVVHPGGFEGHVAWFFALFPGAPAVAVLGKQIPKLDPLLSAALWPLILFLTYVWYFALSYAAIKGFRLLSRTIH